MGNEQGEWIMRGLDRDDPARIRTVEQLAEVIDRLGFLPLFRNSAPGFSVEERTAADGWWTGDEADDPWEWRRLLADSGKAAYGKFFDRKAGFISLKWLSDFANWRRDGYDFDAWWEDEKAPFRQKKIMDLFEGDQELYSFDVKRRAGFGGDGEKNFEGVITDLMMETYLVIRDFRQRLNQKGLPYGWHVAVYTRPETIWGYELLSGAYHRQPEDSRQRIFTRAREICPQATDRQIESILKFGANRHG
ncbi:MAG: hypothetical protein K5919_06320 [Clostridiales bacterium]|nr:hypothetical protein [Clostridiales bacterium]